jgi:hypothetical protein
VTFTVQLAPGSSVGPQLLVWAKLPPATMLFIANCTLLGLLMVSTCARLVVPTPYEPKFRAVGLTARKGVLSRIP